MPRGKPRARVACAPGQPGKPPQRPNSSKPKSCSIRTTNTQRSRAYNWRLTEVADGSSYIWRRSHGRLSGIVKPLSSFKDTNGSVCRHAVVVLSGVEANRPVRILERWRGLTMPESVRGCGASYSSSRLRLQSAADCTLSSAGIRRSDRARFWFRRIWTLWRFPRLPWGTSNSRPRFAPRHAQNPRRRE